MTKVDSVGSRGHRFRCARFDEGARVRPISSDTTVGALELWREAPAQHARTSHGSVFAPEDALACEERRTGRCAPAQPSGPRWSVDQAASR